MMDRRLVVLLSLALAIATASTPPWASARSRPSSPGGAASTADKAARARNRADFDFVVETVTENDAGYPTRVTDANRDSLARLTSRLREQAATASDDRLEALLSEWLRFLRHGHLGVGREVNDIPGGYLTRLRLGATAAGDSTSTASATGVLLDSTVAAPTTSPVNDGQLAALGPRLAWTETTVRSRISSLGEKRNPIEGIWDTGGGRYRMAILRADDIADSLLGVLLSTTAPNWSPGQVKAEFTRAPSGALTSVYRMGDHSPRSFAVRPIAGGTVLEFGDGFGGWIRTYPPCDSPVNLDRLIPPDSLFLHRLSPKTLWLRVPDFAPVRLDPIRRLLADSAAGLQTTDNLVIDLRNNGGGSDETYEPLLPLLYTRPIYSIGIEYRATAYNAAVRQQMAQDLPQFQETNTWLADQMEAHLGEFVNPYARAFSIRRYDTVLPYPRRVAVLVDGAGSSGEQFLLEARQSHKVTLFGKSNSFGSLDISNLVWVSTPSDRFWLAYATSRSMRLPEDPVDPDGIPPDRRISPDIEDPVGYAQAWLERQVD